MSPAQDGDGLQTDKNSVTGNAADQLTDEGGDVKMSTPLSALNDENLVAAVSKLAQDATGKQVSVSGAQPEPVKEDVKNEPAAKGLAAEVAKSEDEKLDLLGVLHKNGALTDQQVSDLRLELLKTGMDMEKMLTDKKVVGMDELQKAKAELFEIPYVQPKDLTISPEALSLVPQSVARKYKVLPFNFDQNSNELSVAMVDATDLQVISFLEQKTNTTVKPFAAPEEELLQVIEDRYGASLSSEVKQVIQETKLEKPEQAVTPGVGTEVIRQAPISKIVTYLLNYAVKTRASDVHIEPQEDRTRIRYRIDGILFEKLVLPKQVHDSLVSRVKILSGMKIDERRVPQDGRFNFRTETEEVDLRVSSLPTVHGEKIVMRLLKKTGGAKSLSELGLRGRALKNLEELALLPHGIILVTGPTGSGKTTTLYSLLTKINTTKVNIMTLEDPVEYQIPGVNQVQINPQAGLTFASGLRSFLRQDPNIIMVGEVRDKETAGLAIQAALTGHLVLSTLHTNSSAGALPRLLDMEAEPFLLSSTINAVVAQRVVRLICTHCKKEHEPPKEVIDDLKEVLGSMFPTDKKIVLYKGEGCSECGTTGYSGRIGIFEVLAMSEKIGKLILERAPSSEIEEQAITDGMVTMKQDGYLKVLEGITTMEEVWRVAQD